MSWATWKPSRVTLSRKPPASCSRGANATECTSTSSVSQEPRSAENAASISASLATSIGSTIDEPNSVAIAATRSLSRSFW